MDAAERAPGVLAVITHVNAPRLEHGPATKRMGDPIGPQPLPPFQSDAVLHYGQHVAMVVAETREEANAAAALIEVTYQRDTPVLSYDDPRASRVSHPWTPDHVRGDVPGVLAAADVQVTHTYTTGRTRTIRSACLPPSRRGTAMRSPSMTRRSIRMACAVRWRPRSTSIRPACARRYRSSAAHLAQDCASGRT